MVCVVAVMHRERLQSAGAPVSHVLSFQADAQEGFHDQPIEPPPRPGVPGPPAAAGMRRDAIDIRRDHVRLHFIDRGIGGVPAWSRG